MYPNSLVALTVGWDDDLRIARPLLTTHLMVQRYQRPTIRVSRHPRLTRRLGRIADHGARNAQPAGYVCLADSGLKDCQQQGPKIILLQGLYIHTVDVNRI